MGYNYRPVEGKHKMIFGYLTPATVKMILFLQNLWIQEKGWDDHLKDESIEKWQKIIAQMKELSTIFEPRHIKCENPTTSLFL